MRAPPLLMGRVELCRRLMFPRSDLGAAQRQTGKADPSWGTPTHVTMLPGLLPRKSAHLVLLLGAAVKVRWHAYRVASATFPLVGTLEIMARLPRSTDRLPAPELQATPRPMLRTRLLLHP